MPNQQVTQLNDVFRGLADPTRRAIIERLSRGPAPVTELARPFKMALPSFAQHLDVLEDSGLVTSRKSRPGADLSAPAGSAQARRRLAQPAARASGNGDSTNSMPN